MDDIDYLINNYEPDMELHPNANGASSDFGHNLAEAVNYRKIPANSMMQRNSENEALLNIREIVESSIKHNSEKPFLISKIHSIKETLREAGLR